jgi:hypothetical protein
MKNSSFHNPFKPQIAWISKRPSLQLNELLTLSSRNLKEKTETDLLNIIAVRLREGRGIFS